MPNEDISTDSRPYLATESGMGAAAIIALTRAHHSSVVHTQLMVGIGCAAWTGHSWHNVSALILTRTYEGTPGLHQW
jgi:hypothetical protein